jgi:hypothetical protein
LNLATIRSETQNEGQGCENVPASWTIEHARAVIDEYETTTQGTHFPVSVIKTSKELLYAIVTVTP